MLSYKAYFFPTCSLRTSFLSCGFSNLENLNERFTAYSFRKCIEQAYSKGVCVVHPCQH